MSGCLASGAGSATVGAAGGTISGWGNTPGTGGGVAGDTALKDVPLVAIDVETTGLDPAHERSHPVRVNIPPARRVPCPRSQHPPARPGRPGVGIGIHVIRRDDTVDEADGERLVAAHIPDHAGGDVDEGEDQAEEEALFHRDTLHKRRPAHRL